MEFVRCSIWIQRLYYIEVCQIGIQKDLIRIAAKGSVFEYHAYATQKISSMSNAALSDGKLAQRLNL